MLSLKYSCLPVALVVYNLPLWLCMKASSFILSLIIPRPSSPALNFHVFMEPLYNELNEIFEVGMLTYDASRDQMFQLHAFVLYAINDYPQLGVFSGYSVNGENDCVACREETWSIRLKHGIKFCFMGHRRFLPAHHEFRYDAASFAGTEEHRSKTDAYLEVSILHKIEAVDDFEKSKTWKCISGLYSLPYWDSNLLRYNLNFMNIEKNVCENIYGTILGLEGKSKDNLRA
jgi:hypothetical protein